VYGGAWKVRHFSCFDYFTPESQALNSAQHGVAALSPHKKTAQDHKVRGGVNKTLKNCST
jgi:hypothetical protein